MSTSIDSRSRTALIRSDKVGAYTLGGISVTTEGGAKGRC